jgi:hypothetical protein
MIQPAGGNDHLGGGGSSNSNSDAGAGCRSSIAAYKIGMPNCTTSCGGVEVRYPFGIGPSTSCYMQQPWFNLTCDTSVDPPRLLLLGGDLRVESIDDSIVNVFHTIGSLDISNSSTAYQDAAV